MQFLLSLPGTEIITSLAMLYVMLGMASLGVGIRLRARPQSQLRLQVYSWWWIFPVVTLSLLLHPAGAVLLMLAVCLLAMRELAPFGPRHFPYLGLLVLAAAIVLTFTLRNVLGWLMPVALLGQLAFFLARRSAGALVCLLWLLVCFSTSFLLRYEMLPLDAHLRLGWLFYLYVLTSLNDVAQFIAGTLFGRHHVAPGISPNKTWQGLAGGVAVTLLLSLALGSYLQLTDARRLALFALLLSVGGFCGDLLFSAAKRVLGVKDYSQLIPGHGGILDRVDSLTVTAPLLYFLISHT